MVSTFFVPVVSTQDLVITSFVPGVGLGELCQHNFEHTVKSG